jgi:mRNA interferase RelE/StbE
VKDLEKLDKETARKIVERVNTYLIRDPLKLGKSLTGQFVGLYRYRYGDYRVLYVVDLAKETIMVLKVRHRRDAYEG